MFSYPPDSYQLPVLYLIKPRYPSRSFCSLSCTGTVSWPATSTIFMPKHLIKASTLHSPKQELAESEISCCSVKVFSTLGSLRSQS